ncbi:MMPL family transporter [Bradyrhizobium sp. U87765 SZCCT0131]|uniref:efflux RND transporter permease subunit n=1 Tax=unclassified Bradyrhizobium TaxID=2631580 RepID=UPI001BA6666A|nr:MULTISPECIES: MMPL family transporter [unclassified Bradyrhizobium]MBR1221195.1 MMPL family transporter [Bradyrhizobium sp. U87765 SZCCT0131]MBR1259984.1 MMPL family transporter [Bradyrhizobium sp. U87765 SZCCT0134]MBR1307767.1 MMPL family transporter [Bradyrhizobium sp. U87765 SZCCT0110]MBR1321721.1 MMPL family transporter [Bradyrhizobium sp. U87765 SZCCT0109]MBR1350033.1 MMPL family transporter [Bradyrhizobium sp. U87765 SZCCT0048]
MLDPKQINVGAEENAARRSLSIAFGIERIGLLPMRAPILSCLILVALCIGAFFGLQRIKIDDSLSQLFRSETREYKQYEAVTKRFPSTEFDVLVVVEGKTLLARDNLEKLREFVTDLQLVDGTRGIISLFSARQAPAPGQFPAALFPEKLPEGADYDKFIGTVKSNEIIRGKLLSEDGTLALVVLSLEPAVVSSKGLNGTIGDIRKLMKDDLGDTGLSVQLSGVPVMQLEIRNAVERDGLIYNAAGIIAGCLIAIAFFRKISFMVIAAFPPLLAILLALGGLGWAGFSLNMFLNVMTPLIMVISFSDSMQLTFAARDRLIAGEDRRTAFANAVRVVGPACVLTHATAGISFLALQFSNSDLIRAFGEAGLAATIIALLAVLSFVPVFGVLLVRGEQKFAAKFKSADAGVTALRNFCAWIAVRMVSRPGLFSLIAVVVVGGLALIYSHLEPRYRLADQVPDKQQAVAASSRLDAKLTGANPIDVLIEFPKGASLYAPDTLQTIADVHALVEKQAGVGNVWSLETLRRWLAEKAGSHDVATLKEYVDVIPDHLKRRFVSAEQDAVVVSARVPDKDSSQILPVVENLDKAMDAVRARHPGYEIAVTGLSAIAARNSASMIEKLNSGLTIEFAFVAVFIGLAFRSVVVMFSSILPGIFPVVLSGTVLWALGEGLQFASVVALTVSFGLGLSATIHFLNRLRLETEPGADPAVAVERATVLVGPALILTTVVLACGLVVMVFSDLPSLRLFGWLSAFSMVAALIADLFILRPTAMFLISLGQRVRAAVLGPAKT